MQQFSIRILFVLSLLIGLGTGATVSAEDTAKTAPVNLTIEQWVGHTFTFRELPADKQAAGYGIFKIDQATQGFDGDQSVRLPYSAYVKKQVTVTEIANFPAGNTVNEAMVYMTVNETGEKLVGRSMRQQLDSLLLTSDLSDARNQFLNKTVYPKFRELSGWSSTGETPVAPVAIKIGSPVTVIDVYPGIQSQEPIWLIVSVNNEKAILPINYSWTNTPVASWSKNPAWKSYLFTEDPRISLGWSRELWTKIENASVVEGMNKGQIMLSWGKPVSMEENNSVWIYGSKKLSFDGDVLRSISIIDASK
ncbi:hypothetical protein [Azotosporobacter soli]|uniref:hypothetical protein n=1 Tax=Azotosporobacter soli TaxID=3055040 RepID=UPI0031FEE83F